MAIDSFAPPAAAPAASDKKVSSSWTGIVMVLGALVAGVSTFFPFEKLVFFVNHHAYSAYSVTAQNGLSHTGHAVLTGTPTSSGGRIIMTSSVLVLAMAVLVLRSKGRVWVRIVALLGALGALGMSLAYLAVAKADAKTLNEGSTGGWWKGLVQLGAIVSIAGASVAVIGAIAALVSRRRVA